MKLVNISSGIDIDINENEINELIIEHKSLFTKTIEMLIKQANGEEGDFVLSENNKIIKLEKCSDVIVNFFAMTPNNKKVLNKLYESLEIIANNYVEEKADINARIISLLDAITTSVGGSDLIYDLDYKWSDIFKLYSLQFEENYSDIVNKITSYIKIISQFSDIRVIFLVNVRSFLSNEEMQKVFEMANYCKINIFLLESYESEERDGIKRYVIDKDMCFIDMN